MTKKAQGLPMNVIIIAVIALIVLVVLIVIFTGRAGLFARTVMGACSDQGGVCATSPELCDKFPDKPFALLVKDKECKYKKNGEVITDFDKELGVCCVSGQ